MTLVSCITSQLCNLAGLNSIMRPRLDCKHRNDSPKMPGRLGEGVAQKRLHVSSNFSTWELSLQGVVSDQDLKPSLVILPFSD